MPVVITSCSQRKSAKPGRQLRFSSLPKGTLEVVGAAWFERVRSAKVSFPATELYQGRNFFESRTVAEAVGGTLYIVSAGLGAIRHDSLVPAYSITAAAGAADAIHSRVVGNGTATAAAWWNLVSRLSPFGSNITTIIRQSSPALVLIALPSTYLGMVADDLAAVHGRSLKRVRIFTRALPSGFPKKLQPLVMPYDDRLDGADSTVQGTRADFAARALRHFADHVLKRAPDGGLEVHKRAVEVQLARWRSEEIPVRVRQTDEDLVVLMRRNWRAAGGHSSRMLRVLRDDLGVACEQGRFRRLFAVAKAERGGPP